MRQRVEDLGRIAVYISNLLQHPLFEDDPNNIPNRTEDIVYWWCGKDEESKEEWIYEKVSQIKQVENELYQIYSISIGDDENNCSEV